VQNLKTVAVIAAQVIVREGLLAVLAAAGVSLCGFDCLPAGLAEFDAAVIHQDVLGHDVVAGISAVGRDLRALPVLNEWTPDLLVALIAACPAGFFLQSQTRPEFAAGLAQVLAGFRHIPPEGIDALAIGSRTPHGAQPLTRRELDVMQLAASGATVAEIGRALLMSHSTARTHLRHVYEKLEVRNRAAAVARLNALGVLGALPVLRTAG
jgi:DNA-binding NarL/FixJ family response regulator